MSHIVPKLMRVCMYLALILPISTQNWSKELKTPQEWSNKYGTTSPQQRWDINNVLAYQIGEMPETTSYKDKYQMAIVPSSESTQSWNTYSGDSTTSNLQSLVPNQWNNAGSNEVMPENTSYKTIPYKDNYQMAVVPSSESTQSWNTYSGDSTTSNLQSFVPNQWNNSGNNEVISESTLYKTIPYKDNYQMAVVPSSESTQSWNIYSDASTTSNLQSFVPNEWNNAGSNKVMPENTSYKTIPYNDNYQMAVEPLSESTQSWNTYPDDSTTSNQWNNSGNKEVMSENTSDKTIQYKDNYQMAAVPSSESTQSWNTYSGDSTTSNLQSFVPKQWNNSGNNVVESGTGSSNPDWDNFITELTKKIMEETQQNIKSAGVSTNPEQQVWNPPNFDFAQKGYSFPALQASSTDDASTWTSPQQQSMHEIKVPVPQPYVVPVPVPQPFNVPIYKLVTKEVEKRVPVTVEKLVPKYIEKPYKINVEIHHPVNVPKKYPVKVPVYVHKLHKQPHRPMMMLKKKKKDMRVTKKTTVHWD